MRLEATLERRDGARWVDTGIAPIRTPSSVLAYPGLGHVQNPALAATERYRVRLTCRSEPPAPAPSPLVRAAPRAAASRTTDPPTQAQAIRA